MTSLSEARYSRLVRLLKRMITRKATIITTMMPRKLTFKQMMIKSEFLYHPTQNESRIYEQHLGPGENGLVWHPPIGHEEARKVSPWHHICKKDP